MGTSNYSDEFSLVRLEEGVDDCGVMAVARAAHRYLETVLTQELRIIAGALLAAAIRMIDASLGRLAERHRQL